MSGIIDIPVVIVGGGSCGLNLSIFLSDLDIKHVLFERHPGTSILPKAHVINQRTMEIFRQHGIADSILKHGTPPRMMSKMVWQTSLGGDNSVDGQVLGSVDTWGCKEGTEQNYIYRRDAPLLPSNLPLLRSEPIFQTIAEERNPGKVLFGHTVTDFKDEKDHVIIHVQSKDGTKSTYRAKYLFGADGGKTVGPKLGIEMDGPKNMRQATSVHFKADLSQYWDESTCIVHFASPENGRGSKTGSMLPLGPTWGRHCEEWQAHFFTPIGEPPFSKEHAVSRLRKLLKLPDLQVEVIGTSNWVLERVLARKYGAGRIFLGGDATHRHPPTTGLGLNTAVQDAHNIAWKLSYVLNGTASPNMLESYEIERRHIGKRNCDWALFTSKRHAVINAALGLLEGQAEANTVHLTSMFNPYSEIGRAGRAVLKYVIDGQSIEVSAHEMDLGFFYPEGNLVSDGTDAPLEDPTHQKYTPTTRPGHRLPHVWLEHLGGIISTHDLVGTKGDFLLITDYHGQSWVDAAMQAVKANGVKLRVALIRPPYKGVKTGDYVDFDEHWSQVRGIKDGGAILVRPDTIVGWRSLGPGNSDDISTAFDVILGKTTSSKVSNVVIKE